MLTHMLTYTYMLPMYTQELVFISNKLVLDHRLCICFMYYTHILCQIKPDVCTLRVLADLVSKNMVFGAMLCFRAETYGPVGISSCLSKQKRRSFHYCFSRERLSAGFFQ